MEDESPTLKTKNLKGLLTKEELQTEFKINKKQAIGSTQLYSNLF